MVQDENYWLFSFVSKNFIQCNAGWGDRLFLDGVQLILTCLQI
jgi:hypothetical protein